MRVQCEVEEIEMDGDYDTVPGICVRCQRCQAEVEVFGTSSSSVRRGLVMLRDECPNEENNFYVAPEGDDEPTPLGCGTGRSQREPQPVNRRTTVSVWNQTAKKGGEGQFEKAPPGNHPAVLVAIVDMGTQRNEYQGTETEQRRAFFVWELVTKKMSGTKGVNHVIGIDLTVSLNEKAKLRKWIEARMGKHIPEGGQYDIAKELGQPCLLNVVEKNGYPKVDGVSAVPDGLTVPAPQRELFISTLDEFRAGKVLPGWVPYLYGQPIAEHIQQCVELEGAPPPEARWDYSDGTTVVKGVTTTDLRDFLATCDPLKIKVKPAGAPNGTARPATDYPELSLTESPQMDQDTIPF